MKTVACMALTPGMVIGEDVLSHSNKLLYPKNTVVDDTVIARLSRHSIMVVSIMEDIDYATTHYEKVRLSKEFKVFESTYQKWLPIYKRLTTYFVENNTPIQMDKLMDIYTKK